MLKLYDYPQCPFGQKTRIVLAEKQLDYDMILVDLRKNEQHAPDFLALNPFHKVPVLVDEEDGEGRTVVYDSTVINEYLEDEYPEPPLLPQGDSAGRARIRLLEDYADNAFTLSAGTYLIEHAKAAAERDPDRLRRAKDEVDKAFALLERELAGGKEYLGGDFSLADAAFAPRLILLVSRNVPLPDGARLLRAYVDRLRQRESVRRLEGL
ncbi:MAG TPA: glutathione S-transferase family protein [Candidatus Binatia bacterium]|nr:glutathione S-transferase family protein [Candidatus Binatia bacterium]